MTRCLRFARALTRFLPAKDGATAVEFALVALPFLGILTAAIQLFIYFQAQAVLETAAEQAGRLVLTGQVQSQNLTQAQFQTKVCSFIPAFLNCSGVMIDLQTAAAFSGANISTPTLTYNAQGQVTNTWAFQPGAQGSIVVLRVMYQLPIVAMPRFTIANLSNGTRLLMATAVFRNETY